MKWLQGRKSGARASRKKTEISDQCVQCETAQGIWYVISAYFYDPSAAVVQHAVLVQLTTIYHRHTEDKIATALNVCLTEWQLGADKVMMNVSDNGSSMVKATQLHIHDDWLSASDGSALQHH